MVGEANLSCFFDTTKYRDPGVCLPTCSSLSRRQLPVTTDLVEKAQQDEENEHMPEDAATLINHSNKPLAVHPGKLVIFISS